MEQSAFIEKIGNVLGDAVIGIREIPNNDILIEIRKDELFTVMEKLKNDGELMFDCLMNHTGVDYRDRFGVMYNLFSFSLNRKITVRAYLDAKMPEVASLEPLFRGINWFERETYDMLGIKFIGHGNLKRLLLPDDWEGYPLRKDYVYPAEYRGIDNGKRGLIEDSSGGVR